MIDAKLEGEVLCLRVDGALSIYEAAEAKTQLCAHLAQAREISLDLAELSDIDGAGVQWLILLRREAAAAGLPLSLRGLSAPAQEVLALLGLIEQFAPAMPEALPS